MARRGNRPVRDLLLPVPGLTPRAMSDAAAHSNGFGAGPDAPGAEAAALRIAGVDPERGFAGGETQVLGLTLALRKMGHAASLICDPAGQLWERAQSSEIPCHALRIRNSVDFAAGMRLRSILRREHFDIVHFHTARAHAMAPFARGHAGALVVTRRMDYRPNRMFAPYLYNHAVDGVAAISAEVADSLARARVPRERVTIISSGVDCVRFRPPSADERRQARTRLNLADHAIAIGTVGALEERKGHRFLLAAMAELKGGAGAAAVCAIAGEGSQRAVLEREAARLGLDAAVRFAGRVEDVRAILWALDIFVFPSLHEGLGVALLEAAACGLPAVASNAGGIAGVIAEGRTGLLVPPANPHALAEAIRRLVEAPEERAAMGAAARERVMGEYTMDAMAQRTLQLYRRCLAARRSED
jgi:glycosyltransferase involved in cell wall biosynthesis